MRKFEVSTDSTSDLYAYEYEQMEVAFAPLEYTMAEGDNIEIETDNYTDKSQYLAFYDRLRNGVIAKTSILSVQAHVDMFRGLAEKGVKNLLHISQGYGLSPTVDNANAAIAIVKEEFPDIDYVAVESNTTTGGEGLVVRAAVKMRDEGKTKEEALDKINEIKGHIQHFVLVNDLKFLARGGRISKASANIGSFLQVKPIIEFGRDGKLKVCRKEMGLKKALTSIVRDYSLFTMNEEFPYVVIVHTGNEPLALELRDMLNEKYGLNPEVRIMGPIIGAHVGPGAVAYCFISNEERPYA